MVSRVANGYVGECVANGVPKVCLSHDAVHWSLDPDPGVMNVVGSARFNGWSIAHTPAGWVGVGTSDPALWYSADGVNWSAVTPVSGLGWARVQVASGLFEVLSQRYDPDNGQNGSTPRLLISSDGRTWTWRDLPEGFRDERLAGDIGLVAVSDLNVGSVPVASLDGERWQEMTLPDPEWPLISAVRLETGRYVGLGQSWFEEDVRDLWESSDGLSWQTDTGTLHRADSLSSIDGKALVIAPIPGTTTRAVWISADGAVWARICTLTGALSSISSAAGLGDLVELYDGSRLAAVGAMTGTGIPSLPPTPEISPSPSAAPGRTVMSGGWEWHELTSRPDSVVVPTSRGYFGRCGEEMCTSKDGWTWTSPPDPTVFRAPGNAVFTPEAYVRRPDGSEIVTASEGVWYSRNGIDWFAAQVPGAPDWPVYFGPAAGSQGFAILGETFSHTGIQCRVYTSPDGAVWTKGQPIDCGSIHGGNPDGAAGRFAGSYYSPDGRTWIAARLAGTAYPLGAPYRLPDGSLVVSGGRCVLRSTDGGSNWNCVSLVGLPDDNTPPGSTIWLAGVGGRIVGQDLSTDVAWESTDSGASFHLLVRGTEGIQQFGDLALADVGTGNGYAGRPVGPEPGSIATPAATSLPASLPRPQPTAEPTPAGGISSAEATRIARIALHPSRTDSVATQVKQDFAGRWIWSVSFKVGGTGPVVGSVAEIDLVTGEILATYLDVEPIQITP